MAPVFLEGERLVPGDIPFEAMQRHDVSGKRIMFEEKDRHYFFIPSGTFLLFDQYFNPGQLSLMDGQRDGKLGLEVAMKRLKIAKGISLHSSQDISISRLDDEFTITADPVAIFMLDAFYLQHEAEFSLVIADDGSSMWLAGNIPDAEITFKQNVHFKPVDSSPLFVGTVATAEQATLPRDSV